MSELLLPLNNLLCTIVRQSVMKNTTESEYESIGYIIVAPIQMESMSARANPEDGDVHFAMSLAQVCHCHSMICHIKSANY